MDSNKMMREIDRKRDLWDSRSYFRMWNVSCVTLKDLDELETCVKKMESGDDSHLSQADEIVKTLLIHMGYDSPKTQELKI